MYKKPTNVSDVKEAIKFFDWAYTNGDKMADELDYVPLSPEEKSEIRAIWKQVNLQ
jgi:phosphate transport system substrate-binding protein